ncbi:MAG TPA: gliding motility-associated C-terminal domain-containing protein [Dinghuibacter sp.]|uniref:T9SS type B sorting domain-containing protein n=1 Tax=Dinghuibacter sp. TaxID=2024697 RepID=UPI002C4AAA82|nr:gliding motility-associated C-terminal domain-containing protein [Dinghuibacter sp.]HTJ14623.1 gliding motility-associated C-terminal domain-containing protein [Dinghuibacter sp.]
MRTHYYLLFFLLAASKARAQENYDTILCSSTCVNTVSTFNSPLFDSLPFPKKILWNFGDPAAGIYNNAGVKSPTHTYTTPGTYYIWLKVFNTSLTDSVMLFDTITVGSPIPYNFGPDMYLCGKTDTLLKAPVVPGAKYQWNNVGVPDTTDTLRVTISGVYTVSINGCGLTDSIGVFITDSPKLNLGKNHVMCDSANLVLDATTENGYYTWKLNGAVLSDTAGQFQTHYPGGLYSVTDSVPGCGIFKDSVSITYASPLKPAFRLLPDTLLCPKQVLPLIAHLDSATAYDWSTGATDSMIEVTQPGDYYVFVTFKNLCQVTDSVLVTYRNDQALDFHDTAICRGSTLVLNADFGQGTYAWTAIPPQRNDQNQTGQATYFVYQAGTYAVTAQVGQCIYKDTLTVTFDDSLRVYLPKDTSACNGSDFTLTLKGNADTVTWQDGSQSFSYHIPQPGGSYTAIARNGCGSDTLTSVVTFGECACNLLMPNAFTPNADGINDILKPLNFCLMSAYRMEIYDRYGHLVFHAESPDDGWDGTVHGQPSFPGNYVWVIRYTNAGQTTPTLKKGNVVLIR